MTSSWTMWPWPGIHARMDVRGILGLWLFAAASLASLIDRQTEFIALLLNENNEGMRRALEMYPDEIDPSYGEGDVIIHACLTGDTALLRSLLKHPLVDPNVREGAPMAICVNLKRIDCLMELMKDGQVSLEPLNRLFVPNDMSVMWFLGSLSNPMMEACWNGNAKAIEGMNLASLGYKHFDILFARAKNHPKVIKALQRWFLRAIRLPANQVRDGALCKFMDRLPPMPAKRLQKIIKHRVSLGLVCKEPLFTAPALVPELADLISLQFNPDHVPESRMKMKIHPSLYLSIVLAAGLLMKKTLYRVDLPGDPHNTLMMGINVLMGRYYFWEHLPWVKWKLYFVDILVIDLISIILFCFLSTYLFLIS